MQFVLQDALFGLLGGLMIGLASAAFLLLNGRIAGISGIASSILQPSTTRATGENIAFLAGLVGAPALVALVAGGPAIGVTTTPMVLVAGGLLVGFGTRMGSGCTSGHGVCGLSRFSPRSLAATLVFMAAGIAVASLVTPLLGGP